MTAVGGSVESVSIKGRVFSVAADAATNRKKGGFENEVKSNGDGTARIIKTRVPFALSDIQLVIDDGRDDQGYLQTIANLKDFVAMSITYASGYTHQGTGIIVGEVNYDSQNSTATLSLQGSGTLTQQ